MPRILYFKNKRHKRLVLLPRMHESYGTCADEIKIKLHTILSTTIPQPKTYQWQPYSGTSTKLSISKVQS